MWLDFLFALVIPLLIKGQASPSITLTHITPNEIRNGGIVCPNLYPIEMICTGIEVTALHWQRNGTNIGGGFTPASHKGDTQKLELITLILDSITTRNTMANMTSRLLANISNLMIGEEITCDAIIVQDAITLNYSLREHPPEAPTNISVSDSTESNDATVTVDISITWDSAFNLLHSVSSYRVIASGGSAASCPPSCDDPSGTCMCTGLRIGEDTNFTITAINCGNQVGIPVDITARPRVPSKPSECSVLPVYSSAGNLNVIDLTWAIVNNPPEFLPGVSQDVTGYSIAVSMMDPMIIPASTACPTSTCNYSVQLLLSVFNSPLSVSMSAVNVIGRGDVCTPQTKIDTRNQIFLVILDVTNIENQTVVCNLLSAEECEFCYSAGEACQNLTCIPATETPTLLPSLTELTYCYRATASISGNAVAVIQDTFNTSALGTTTDGPADSRCSSDSIGSVSIPHGLGCYDGQRRGTLTNYQCDKWYALSGGSSRTCMGDGNWDGEVPECRVIGENIAMLVVSILLSIFSLFLTVFAAVALIKEISLKKRNLFNFHILPLWTKIIYIIFFTIECLFLLVVLSLWISTGVIPDSPNSGSQQSLLLISALVLALPWIIVTLIFLFVMSKCSSRKNKVKPIDKTPSPPVPPPVYAVPDKSKKKNRQPEVEEHKPVPAQQEVGKTKGFLVKKGKGKNKALENIELPSYDVLEGPGHHTGKPPPKTPVTQEKYDVLDVKAGVHSTIPGQPQHKEAEYSQMDKRSSQKRLLSETSSDKQK